MLGSGIKGKNATVDLGNSKVKKSKEAVVDLAKPEKSLFVTLTVTSLTGMILYGMIASFWTMLGDGILDSLKGVGVITVAMILLDIHSHSYGGVEEREGVPVDENNPM